MSIFAPESQPISVEIHDTNPTAHLNTRQLLVDATKLCRAYLISWCNMTRIGSAVQYSKHPIGSVTALLNKLFAGMFFSEKGKM